MGIAATARGCAIKGGIAADTTGFAGVPVRILAAAYLIERVLGRGRAVSYCAICSIGLSMGIDKKPYAVRR
jgi:hypothetical protein